MQTKTIKKLLNKKIEEWIGSIEDTSIKKLAIQNTIVTGGSIASMLLGEEINDFDIYFKTKEAVKAISEYYVKKTKCEDLRILDGAVDSLENEYGHSNVEKSQVSIALESLDKDRIKIFIPNKGFWQNKNIEEKKEGEKRKFEVAFISPNAITLTDKIQLVIRFHGTPEEIHKNYDFIHATNYYDYSENKLITKKDALESLLSKQLKYSGSLYPITSVIRSRKFIKRGWNISAGEYFKMCHQVSSLDLNDPSVLEEQLIGVDVAYFKELITVLRKKMEKHPEFKPTAPWLFTIIDKIFNEDTNLKGETK